MCVCVGGGGGVLGDYFFKVIIKAEKFHKIKCSFRDLKLYTEEKKRTEIRKFRGETRELGRY